MKLSELINNIKVIQITGKAEGKEIEKISIDSRSAGSNSLFIAIEGYKTDGHKFITDAINNGATAVVLQNNDLVPEQIFDHTGCIKIVVPDSRKALAEIANEFYNRPSAKLKLVGITGTKGKTTTAFYIRNIFEHAGFKTGQLGTIANFIGSKEFKASLTTPQSHEINELLSEMVAENFTHCVMEVSSHAALLNRVDGLDFNAGVFTNITSDHMDFHKTFENYLEAKKVFFDLLSSDASLIYNNDDVSSENIILDSKAAPVSFGKKDNSNFRIYNIEYDLEGTTFDLNYNGKVYSIETGLVGEFNAYNASAAFAVTVSLGVDPVIAAEGIKLTPQVSGRFEVIAKGNKKVIVDYSHTSDSLKQALKAIHHIVKGTRPVHTVFGCGGDRDKTKRPIMGGIAAEMSDKAYITSDNPRTENPFEIIEDIKVGIKTENFIVIENREEAIKTAIQNSEDNAVILIAGKGHESYQEINGVRSHFSDQEIAEKYLAG